MKGSKKILDTLERLREAYRPSFPLSSSWRLRSSIVPEVELKYIQEDIQNFVDILVGKGYRVVWKGQETLPGFTVVEGQTIYLSYGPVKGQAPVDPFKVDIVAGVGVHEVGHVKLSDKRPAHIPESMKLASNVLEDIYIDYNMVKDFPVLGQYIKRCRAYYRQGMDKMAEYRLKHPKPFTRDEVQTLWSGLLLYNLTDMVQLIEDRAKDPTTFADGPALESAMTALVRIGSDAVKKLDSSPTTYMRLLKAVEKALLDYETETAQAQADCDWQKAVDAQQRGTPWNGPPLPPNPFMQDDQGKGGKSDKADQQDDQGVPHSGQGQDEGEDGQEKGSSASGSGQDEEGDEPQGPNADPNCFGPEPGDGQQGQGHAAGQEGQGADGNGEACPACGGTHEHNHIHMPGGAKAGQVWSEPNPNFELGTCTEDLMVSMPKGLAGRVWVMQEHEAEDVTQLVGARSGFIMLKPGKTKLPMIKGTKAEAIRQAFEVRRHMNTTHYPFQEQGRLCKRTLPRILLGAKDIYEETVDEDEIDVALGLLLDCSGSISSRGGYHYNSSTGESEYQWEGGGQWGLIVETCQVMEDAFRDGQLDLFIMAYRSGQAFRVYEPGYDGLRLLNVHPSGGTPSVPGIKALAHRMQKLGEHRRDKIIIHLTDGEPNDGGGPDAMRQTVVQLENKGWKVIGMGVQVPPQALAKQYSRYFAIEDFDEVPDRLRAILEKL